jgi:hypothetical protein
MSLDVREYPVARREQPSEALYFIPHGYVIPLAC